jgi:hypothetical protein
MPLFCGYTRNPSELYTYYLSIYVSWTASVKNVSSTASVKNVSWTASVKTAYRSSKKGKK